MLNRTQSKIESEKTITARNKANMLKALELSKGVVTKACKKAKISKQTHYNYMDNDPEYKAAVGAVKESALDFVEEKLFSAMSKGNVTAMIFYLKTQGKQRGYIEPNKLTIEGNLSGDAVIKIGDDSNALDA